MATTKKATAPKKKAAPRKKAAPKKKATSKPSAAPKATASIAKKTSARRRAVVVAGSRTPFVKAFKEFMRMDTIALGVSAVGGLLERTQISQGEIDAIVWGGVILPAITLGWFSVAANLRLVRSAMLEVLDSEYIKLARAKGVPERTIIWKHALRNAMIPPLTFAGVTLGAMVSGSLVAETVFAWPGLGQLAVQAMQSADYPMLQGVVMIFTLIFVLAALLVDILYAYINPRIRYS